MDFIKMNSGANETNLINLMALAEMKMILDDDTGELIPLDNETRGYKVIVGLIAPNPVYLSGGAIADGVDGSRLALCLSVISPDGTETNYLPAINGGQIVWAPQS